MFCSVTSAGVATLLALAATVNGIPVPKNEVAAFTTICGQFQFSVSGKFTLYNNLWNKDAGAGSQCSQMDAQGDGSVSWTSSWSWSDNDDTVKSYSNIVTGIDQVKLKDIQSLPTTWNWYYTDDTLKADIAYDTFTAPNVYSANEFEVMVWVGNIGHAVPLSYGANPIASPEINGKGWDLWKGPRGNTQVFSFVAQEPDYNWSGDLMDFFWNLINDHGLPEDQVLMSVGAGTESFHGTNAVFHTTKFVLDQNVY